MSWYVVNVADADWVSHESSGRYTRFNERDDNPFPHYGINIHVLQPGEPNGRYHRENLQEDFLVLHGECIAIVEGGEQRLRQWDFFHCPPEVTHILVGAGDGPCAILMVGARPGAGVPQEKLFYPRSELAAKYDASAARDTASPAEAYADWTREFPPVQADWPL